MSFAKRGIHGLVVALMVALGLSVLVPSPASAEERILDIVPGCMTIGFSNPYADGMTVVYREIEGSSVGEARVSGKDEFDTPGFNRIQTSSSTLEVQGFWDDGSFTQITSTVVDQNCSDAPMSVTPLAPEVQEATCAYPYMLVDPVPQEGVVYTPVYQKLLVPGESLTTMASEDPAGNYVFWDGDQTSWTNTNTFTGVGCPPKGTSVYTTPCCKVLKLGFPTGIAPYGAAFQYYLDGKKVLPGTISATPGKHKLGLWVQGVRVDLDYPVVRRY